MLAAGILAVALVVVVVALIRTGAELAHVHRRAIERERDDAVRFVATESERRSLREVLDGVGEGLLALDRKRRVVLANRRFLEMFDVDNDIVGKTLGEAIRVSTVFKACDAALAGRESTERFAIPVGVAERRVEVRAIALPTDEIAAVALFIDVTQLERLEDIRRDFISDFSHEVRTPLAGLASAVESFDLGAPAPEDDQQLRRIMSRQLARLQRLVDDLSELSRIEAGDLTLDQRDIDLRRLIGDVCEDFAERAAQKVLRFEITGEAVRTFGDPLRIQQAFSNLIDNAIKYGGDHTTIDIAIAARDGDAVVSVTDHGAGIEADERERIFRRFYRGDKSRSQDIAGTGLGLAITKHLIMLHHGSIDVESERGKGSTFIVSLGLST